MSGNNLFHSFARFNIGAGEEAHFAATNSTPLNVFGRITDISASTIDGRISSSITGAGIWLINPNGFVFGPGSSVDVPGSFAVTTADFIRFDNGDTFFSDPAQPLQLSVANPAGFGFIGSNTGRIRMDDVDIQLPAGETLGVYGGDIVIENVSTGNPNPYKVNLVAADPGSEISLADIGGTEAQTSTLIIRDSAFDMTLDGGDEVYIVGGLLITENMDIRVTSVGSTDSGELLISGRDVIMADDVEIEIEASAAGVTGTDLVIMADGSLSITDDPNNSFLQTEIYNRASGDNSRAGDITITANTIDISNADIDSNVSGNQTDSGVVTLRAVDELMITDNADIRIQSRDTGRGDSIIVEGANINLDDADIQTDVFGTGVGARVEINGGNLTLSNNSNVTAENSFGQAGSISITADDVAVNGSRISTVAFEDQDGGDIAITANSLLLEADGRVNASAVREGNGGNVTIDVADTVTIDGQGETVSTGIVARAGDRDLEPIFGTEPEFGVGNGGNIQLNAGNLVMLNGGLIATDATRSGNAGNIQVVAGSVDMAGQGTQIVASTTGSGDAGSISIGTPQSPSGSLIMSGESFIATSTSGLGNAGSISIDTSGAVTLRANSPGPRITSSATGPDPDQLGGAGSISVRAASLNIQGGGTISTDTQSNNGPPANIDITAGSVVIQGDPASTAQAIDALFNGQQPTVQVTGITSNSTANQRGGNITLNVSESVSLFSGIISASASGAGGGGDVTIGNPASPMNFFLIDSNSAVLARAQQGNGGNIFVYADNFIRDPGSLINADSALGNAGSVVISSIDQDITGSILDLDNQLLNAPQLVNQACDVARFKDRSSLTLAGKGGLPLMPGEYIPSKLPPAAPDQATAGSVDQPEGMFAQMVLAEQNGQYSQQLCSGQAVVF